MARTITTEVTKTFEYDAYGRVRKETVTTVEKIGDDTPAAPPGKDNT